MKLVKVLLSTPKIKILVIIILVIAIIGAYNKKASAAAPPPPVFWNEFTVEAVKDNVMMKWVVTEYNNKVFYIQHSLDGVSWETIDSVKTKNSPYSLDEYSYSYTNKAGGRHYYRVRHLDNDMRRDGYSKVRTIVKEEDTQSELPATNVSAITISPNPATDRIRIVNTDGNDRFYSKALIFDLSGKLVAEKKLDGHSNTISIKELPAGIYMMRGQGDNGSFFSQKIIKQ